MNIDETKEKIATLKAERKIHTDGLCECANPGICGLKAADYDDRIRRVARGALHGKRY